MRSRTNIGRAASRWWVEPIAVVFATVIFASLLPAMSAARTDPATTLRED